MSSKLFIMVRLLVKKRRIISKLEKNLDKDVGNLLFHFCFVMSSFQVGEHEKLGGMVFCLLSPILFKLEI